VTGGAPFKSWIVSGQSPAVYTGFANPQTTSSIEPYFAKPEDMIDVTCTVTTMSPDLSIPLNESLKTDAPTYYHDREPCGVMTLLPDNVDPYEFTLYGATHPLAKDVNGQLILAGMYYDARVERPPQYGPSQGTFTFVQLITDRSQLTYNGQTDYAQPVREKALDRIYPQKRYVPTGDHIEIIDGKREINCYIFGDRPRFEGIEAGHSWLSYDADFELFVVFQPPPSSTFDVAVVPLIRKQWYCRGSASRGNPWQKADTGSKMGKALQYPPHPRLFGSTPGFSNGRHSTR
jgi:hypothetical protein